MRGDKLVIQEWHVKAGKKAAQLIIPQIKSGPKHFVVTVAGESGSGKSEIAEVLAEELEQNKIKSAILQQDDYFVYPPQTNAQKRRENIKWVGMNEVKLDLLDSNLKDFKEGKQAITKPLVIFQKDSITEERIELDGTNVVIAEGTYTTSLKNVDCRIFIDRTYEKTKKARLLRGRDKQSDYLEKILKIEHKIISSHKPKAHIIVTKDYEVEEAK